MNLYKIKQDQRIVSERIGKEVKMDGFCLSIDYLKTIHRRLFEGIYPLTGEFRNFNMTKREIILNWNSVNYSDCRNIYKDLFQAIIVEYNKDYTNMDIEDVIKSISRLTVGIWKTHPFMNGNTRTVAVFIQKYLNSLGYNVSNSIFKDNYLYFRRSLVKASYENKEFFIESDISCLERFFYKVLVDKNIYLDIDEVYIDGIVRLNNGKKRALTKD